MTRSSWIWLALPVALAILQSGPALAQQSGSIEKTCRWEVTRSIVAGTPAQAALRLMEMISTGEQGCGIDATCRELFERIVRICREAAGETVAAPGPIDPSGRMPRK